jgi:hypothetical protein
VLGGTAMTQIAMCDSDEVQSDIHPTIEYAFPNDHRYD